MGHFATLAEPISSHLAGKPTPVLVVLGIAACICGATILNLVKQLFFQNPNEPPMVFHWVPFVGSTVTYGMDPYKFFFDCQKKYGDIFTFVLLGKKTTVYLGTKGNDFILNGKLREVNAEEIYGPLTTPVFGKGVVYDVPNAKLMEQKKFVKYGLTTEALRSYVPLIVDEVNNYIKRSAAFKGPRGIVDIPAAMAEITIFTASRALQGKEVRDKLDGSFADLYHDLDMGFRPINFMLPWAPLPQNRKRDIAQRKMAGVYLDIINSRRQGKQDESHDMIWNLMGCSYKDGTPLSDREIAHMMIALLMAGQHSSAATSSWIMLRLASRPDIVEELYQEQKRVLGADLPPLTHEDLSKLALNNQVVKETLRIHAPIHSVMRKVKSPMAVEGTPYTIPTSHVLLAAPGVTMNEPKHFPNPSKWEPHRWDDASKNSKVEYEEDQFDYGFGLISKGGKSPYLPFGAGRHRCIGEQFAYLQLTTIVATLVRQMKFKNLEGRSGVVDTDYSSLFSQPMRPAIIQWEKRE